MVYGRQLLYIPLVVLAIVTCAFGEEGVETRIVTLLPESSASMKIDEAPKENPNTLSVYDTFAGNKKKIISYLQFSAENLPDDATITGATLRLVRKEKQPKPLTLVINVASIPRDNWSENIERYNDKKNNFIKMRIRSVGKKGNRVDTNEHWHMRDKDVVMVIDGDTPQPGFLRKTKDGKKYIALLLLPGQSGSGRLYYPSKSEDFSAEASKQPRLIITYTVPKTTISPSPDSQSDGRQSIRSPRAFILKENIPPQDNYRALEVVDHQSFSYTPAIYGGMVYVVRNYASKLNNETETYLDAQAPLDSIVWSVKLPKLPVTARVVVNNSGRLTIVSKKRIIVYQLNTAEPGKAHAAALRNETLEVFQSPMFLVSGPDGSLYVIDGGDIYALNPDLRLLWRMSMGKTESARMTLSPDGRFVYATGIWVDGNDKKCGLLAINAQTGKSSARLDFPAEITSFHAPVIVKHPDGADYIWIAANSTDSGVLRCIKNKPSGKEGDKVAKPTTLWEKKGFFSQPILDATTPEKDLSNKTLYVVSEAADKNEGAKLFAISALTTGNSVSQSEKPIPDTKASYLWGAGNLVMDKIGNVIFWENGTLYCYDPAKNQVFAAKPEVTTKTGLEEELQLLFGSDGALYANNSSTGALYALIPLYRLPAKQESVSTIYSPTHLWVDGTAGQGKEWVLKAGGSVLLGNGFSEKKGFSVKKGTTLNVKVNVPN